MATILQSLRQPRCIADSASSFQRREISNNWHLHTGTVQLFIVGPGENAWLAVSEPCYSGPIGTEDEIRIANRAVRILDRLRRYDYEAGPKEIKAALRQAASELKRGKAEKMAPLEIRHCHEFHTPSEKADPKPADMEVIQRVIEAVSRVTGIPDHEINSVESPGRDKELINARSLLQGIVKELHPDTYIMTLAAAMGRSASGVSSAFHTHTSRRRYNKAYGILYRQAIALCKTTSARSTKSPCTTSGESRPGMAASC